MFAIRRLFLLAAQLLALMGDAHGAPTDVQVLARVARQLKRLARFDAGIVAFDLRDTCVAAQ